MEIFNVSMFLISFLLLLFLNVKRFARRADPKLPRGPWKLPIIGSIHHLVGSLPHRSLRDLSTKHGPLMLLKLGEVNTLVVSSPEGAREIMKTHDITFANRPMLVGIKISTYGGKDLVFAPYGDYWRELRKMCVLELLSFKRVQSFRSIREEEVFNLIRSISSMNNNGSSLVNLTKKLFMLTNDIIMRAAIGNKCKDQNALLVALTEMAHLSGGFDLADLFPSSFLASLISRVAPKMKMYHEKVDRILDDIIRDHLERKKASLVEEDLLDVLLRVHEEGGLPFALTMDAVKAVTLDMLAGGSESAFSTLDWAMAELMRNPEVMKKAQSEVREVLGREVKVTEGEITELNYLKLVLKETLRLHPPIPLLVPRECREKVEVLGYEIPEKTRVIVNVWALGRDPKIWDDAEEFKPERFDGSKIDFKGTNFEYLPFGAGRRMCPGITFGLANMELALACLLYYYNWELADGMLPGDMDMAESSGVAARRKSELCLRAIPYISCPME
ncbi:premnaspirodiene oxygenase-like [Phoenix dactylifera]|uniref:Premnaspirodiene oxygenase-like n=1 Tax=Phoenix dactylifera TaxID=42345 RepID=A0A8B7C949_PHODC|nr:premnaspirodiene oxygenase-like [Phoenix dactylifera]